MQQIHSCPSRASCGNLATMLAFVCVSAMLGPSMGSSLLRARRIDAPPKAGDLVSHVKDQLADDHQELGKVSASLMSVQSSVDNTERSMLGKVLDLQTARTFFTRHEEIDTANDKMTDENAKLNSQVEDLSSTISKTQKEFLIDAQKNRIGEGKLREQIIENDGLMQSMNAELSKSDDIKAALKKLEKIHRDLMEEAVNISRVGRKTETMLHDARGGNRAEVKKHKSLREQLVSMNNYSSRCYANVAKTSKKLGVAMISDAKDSQASALTLKQKKKANEAGEQRLLAEHALLVSQVKKIEHQGLQEVGRVKDQREDLQTLEHNIVAEVRKMEDTIKAEKERVKSLSVDLMENAQAEEESNTRKEAMDVRIEKLIAEVHEGENPIIIATTEGQNQALEAELNEGFVLWKNAKRSETAALLNVDQVAAELSAVEEGLKLAEKALGIARSEGRKKVEEAVKKAAVSQAKSQLLMDKARAAILERCKPDWDEIWKKKRAKLVKCKSQKEEFEMETAKKETLVQTLKAQAS